MNQEQFNKAILARIGRIDTEIVRLSNEKQNQVKEPALMSDDGVILSYGQEEYIRGQKDMAVIIEQAKKKEYVRGYKEGKEDMKGEYERGEAEGYQKGLKQGLEVAEEKAKVARAEGYNEGYQNCKDLKFTERYEEGIREGKRLYKEDIKNNLKEFFNNNK